MAKKDLPSIEYLREAFSEKGGRVTWRHRPRTHFGSDRSWKIWNSQNAGKEAGGPDPTKSGTRWVLTICGIHVNRSIVVWALHHGEWPPLMVDHKNRNTLDDRIGNLRLATRSQNGANSRKPVTNSSGFKGVSWHRGAGRWVAAIRVSNRRIHLGLFDDPKDAHKAYVKAARERSGEFACGGT